MKNKKDKRRNADPSTKGKEQTLSQFSASQYERRFTTQERLCEVFAFGCALVASGMGSHMIALVWTIGLGLCAVILAFCFWFTDNELKRRNKPPASALATPPPLTRPKPSATPATLPAIASPSRTPTPVTPLDNEAERLTPEKIRDKLSEADKEGRGGEIRAAFVGIRVDWCLFFWSADVVDKSVRAFFTSRGKRASPPSVPTLVMCTLPKNGHERLPLTDKEVVFRVEGTIEEVSAITAIILKDVRLSRVERSDTPPTSPARPDSANQAGASPSTRAITSLRDLESLTFDQILERFWDARSSDRRERIGQAIVGMRVDWTLTLQSVASASNDRFLVFLTGGRDSEGEDRPEDKYHLGLAAFFIPKEGHERFLLLEEYKQRIRVRGKIKSVLNCNVTLDETEFELVRS